MQYKYGTVVGKVFWHCRYEIKEGKAKMGHKSQELEKQGWTLSLSP